MVLIPPQKMATSRARSTPASKLDRTPVSTPGIAQNKEEKVLLTSASKMDRTPVSTLGIPKNKEEKVLVTPTSKMERTPFSTPGAPRVKEEKIFVTVRVRPLSKKEIASKDQVTWECVDDNMILSKMSAHERLNCPQALSSSLSYTFDKVFGPTCLTDTVYEQGAKNVALSALTGINATIFAYGQTSSGKTFTMRGITDSAVNDIYNHIQDSPERNFTIRISAMEIYNEIVRDLIKPDSGPLRLLDDPEKGTVIEKLGEEKVRDRQHLRQLIRICENQRQVGETSLNDTSSRSHQIIRMTIESSLQESSGCVKSFVASLNFVDLAGSERVSQTHTEGTRLKEGCHINRSLLTLTTVIRKLSLGKRGGHIPYRDSKLTRILQLSLGGNARTAIICTMSPALCHVEQSKNTLSFATRAKEVTNSAQVNMMFSDKQLVKQLQKEVARLEAELRTPESSKISCSEELLMEKELQIKKMEMEMEALKRERDHALSQLVDLRQNVNHKKPVWNPFEPPGRPVKCLTFSGPSPMACDKSSGRAHRARNTMRKSSTVPFVLVNEIRKLEHMQEQLGIEAKRALQVLQKEVACHKLGNQNAEETVAKLQAEIREMLAVRSLAKGFDVKAVWNGTNAGGANLKEEITRLHTQGSTIANLEQQLENVQKSLDKLVLRLHKNNETGEATPKSTKTQAKKRKKMLPLTLSSNSNRPYLIRSPCSPHSSSRTILEGDIENKDPDTNIQQQDAVLGSEKATPNKNEDADNSAREETPYRRRSSSVCMRKMQKMFQNAAEENVRNIKTYVTELKERVAKLQYQKQLLVCQVLELEANEAVGHEAAVADDSISDIEDTPEAWPSSFRKQRQQIVQLWDVCQVSIIHRTQFYLLFRGDPSDQIYIEVELRRLTWLQQHFILSSNESPAPGDDQTISLASSIKALKSEREFLSKRMNSRLTEEEREMLYNKWQIPVCAKQRNLQLACKLWTDPTDPVHIEESAQLVATLVGFCEGGNMSKEMFELNFALPECKKPWLLGRNPIANLLYKLHKRVA